MAGALVVVLLAVQYAEGYRPSRSTPEKYERLIPAPFRRDPERLLREAQRGGGGRETEEALLSALGWLARAQNPDGTWDVPDERLQVEVTGLALIAFSNAGFTPFSPEVCQPSYGNRSWFGSILSDSS